MNFSFKTDLNFIFIIVSLIIAITIAYLYYKNSSLEGPQKKLFIVLRTLSIFFILLLLLSPVISFFKDLTRNPVNIFLIDNSESLLIDNRNERINDVINEKIKESGSSQDLYFLFSGNLYKEVNRDEAAKPQYQGINNFKTNLTYTLNSLRERLSGENVSTVTVISDGIINDGGNPFIAARSLNVPVSFVVVGDTIQKKDLVAKKVFFNKTAFIESKTPVNVEVNSFGYDRDIKVNLFEEDRLIESKDLEVTSGQSVYNVSFGVMSSSEAINKYKVEITGLEDEITLENNFEEFFIRFIDNKFRVLVLAGGPSADFAFLSSEIKKVKNFEATFLTQKSANEFYEGTLPDLNNFNSFILIGFPTSATNPVILNEIKESVQKNNSSIIFFASRNTDYKKLALLEEYLPFKVSGFSDSEEETGIRTVINPESEVFRDAGLLAAINSYPNIFKTASVFSANPSSETVLLMTRNSSPAMIVEKTDTRRSAAFLGYGFYKWRLNKNANNSDVVLNYVLTSALTAVTDKDAKSKFSVETSKDVYSKFENVNFKANITNFELLGGESIKIKISGESFNKEFELSKKGNRYFEGDINVPEDGDYEYTAELFAKGQLQESIRGRFAIGKNNFEYKLTRSDNTILSSLSFETSGYDLGNKSSSEISNFFKTANERSKSEYKSVQKYELNINPYYLSAVIFLLCAEWFLRKRNNLP